MDIDGENPSDRQPRAPSGADAVLRIDCAECALEHTDACQDCVVTFLCDRTPGDAVLIDLAEERAMRLLADAGLAPGLRHRKRSG